MQDSCQLLHIFGDDGILVKRGFISPVIDLQRVRRKLTGLTKIEGGKRVDAKKKMLLSGYPVFLILGYVKKRIWQT